MRTLIFISVALLVLVSCQSASITGKMITTENGSYKNVTPNELNTMLKSKDFVLINVHIPFAGNISGTDASIPYDQIEQRLSELPADTGAKIVLYCRSGRMSQIAAEKLVSLGYTNIWNLDGGMAAWEQAGYKIQK